MKYRGIPMLSQKIQWLQILAIFFRNILHYNDYQILSREVELKQEQVYEASRAHIILYRTFP